LSEGIETGAAIALALKGEIEANEISVAAAISAGGVEAFQPYPAAKQITVAADRDEAPKANGARATRRGEEAARNFGLKHYHKIEISIALAGSAGEAVDWLDVKLRDGVDAVRVGILDHAVPLKDDALNKRKALSLPIRVMGGDLAPAT